MDLSGPLPSGSIEKYPEALPVSRWASQEGSKMAYQKTETKASSKKENGLFSIIENACLFAFLSGITKFKRSEEKKLQ